ncbi:uncharacterized protein LOC119073100 [Bradysia coprophila]|uniref:uncharacterized protein LOC119073100 n=1 Tax=Bradysia coprophila TaxID=38358 RepID=UPI00187D865C|nr:uncharacterized protein LOC119073100 [Bradysia coprophila]
MGKYIVIYLIAFVVSAVVCEDSIQHDGTPTAITLETIDSVVNDIANVYTDKKLEVFIENNENGLEMLHRFAFTTTYRFSVEQLDHLNLEININLDISDNDFDEFVDTIVSFIKKPNFLTIRTRSNKYVYRNYDRAGEEQLGLTMNYDTVPQYIPNIPGHYNGTKWIVRIRSISEPNNNEASSEQQKKLVNLNDERCSLFRFWIDDNFSVTTVSKFLEKHNTGTMKTLTLTYDIKHGSQIFFNRLYVNLKNELNSDHLKGWKLTVDFYSTLWSDDPIYNGNEKVPSIIFERQTSD